MKDVFTPINQSWDWMTLSFGLIVLLGLLIFIYQIDQKRQSKNNEISSMPIILLVALTTLLATYGFVYSRITSQLMENIEIHTDYLQTPYGTIDLAEIKYIYIYTDYPDSTSKHYTEQESILILQEFSGLQHSIYSKTYDIDRIYLALNKVIQQNSSGEQFMPYQENLNGAWNIAREL